VLKIQQLYVTSGDIQILSGINCIIPTGELVVLVGENGSGKSSLAFTLLGHPAYTITGGLIVWNDENIASLSVQDRSLRGLFMTFQQQPILEGVVVFDFLAEVTRLHAMRNAHDNRSETSFDMYIYLISIAKTLGLTPESLARTFDSGFSTGELKRIELMMYSIIKPQITIFDEIDAGLDCGAVEKLIQCINSHRKTQPQAIHIVITHTLSFARSLAPDAVYWLQKGTIIAQGKSELFDLIESKGYQTV